MRRLLFPLLLAGMLVACGDRPAHWDAEFQLPLQSVGLSGSVAVVDSTLDRVMMLTVPAGKGLSVDAIPVGKEVVAAQASEDRESLFVLSRGVQPRKKPDDEQPSLTVIGGGSNPQRIARYPLTDPLRGLAIDPKGKWAVVHEAGGVVVNPNELIFIDLENPSSEPVSKTIRSFGSKPERLTFTDELSVPNGAARRFLIVETEHDVALIDLSDLSRPEVTIPLPKTPTNRTGSPAEVDYSDGEPTDTGDSRIAIRLANDSNVVIVELSAPPPEEANKPFKVTPNVTDVGGTPSAIQFIRTAGELRLAALVPSNRSAALLDPTTTVVDVVALDRAYNQLTLVTDQVSGTTGQGDVALLWSDQTPGIAFWQLDKTTATPFRSVEAYEIGVEVGSVLSVPGDDFAHYKILESTRSTEFFVLDLEKRQAFPLLANASGFEVSVAPDGRRAWAVKPGTRAFASIDFVELHPTSVELERDVLAVYDVARSDGGRAAIALHVLPSAAGGSGLGATVLDALDPDSAETSFHAGLTLGGLK